MRRLIVWGNCQASSLANVLDRAPGIAGVLKAEHHEVWATGDALAANLAAFDEADILVVQDLRAWRQHPLRERLPQRMQVVRFPFCYVAALWPFDAFIRGADAEIIRRGGKFAFQDGLMAELRRDVPDPEARFARYRDLDLPDLPDLRRYAELEEARLRRDDARLGMRIGHFIAETYRTQRLFHAIIHPTPPLVERLAWEVLQKLGLPCAAEDVPRFYDYLAYYQVPLHPQVIAALELTWVDEATRYTFSSKEKLDFETYFRRYIKDGG